MKVHTATFLASSISGISLIACLALIANIYSDVQQIWQELDQEISAFRSETDDLWRDMIKLGQAKGRARRQAGYEGGGGKPSGPSGGGYEAGKGPAAPGGGAAGGPSGGGPAGKAIHNLPRLNPIG